MGNEVDRKYGWRTLLEVFWDWISPGCWYPVQPTQLSSVGCRVRGSVWVGFSTPGERNLHRAENTTQTSTSLFFKGQICSFDLLQSSIQEIFSLMLLLSSFFPPASLSLFRALRLFSGQQKNKVTDVTPIGYASSVLRNSASKWTSMPKIGGKLF